MRVDSELRKSVSILATLDRPIRYILLVAGIISGKGVQQIKSQHRQRLFTARHFITCTVLISFLLTKLIQTWDSEQDRNIEILLVKIATCAWLSHCTVDPCILFLAGHSKWGLEKYYAGLADVEEKLTALGAKISYMKIKILVGVVSSFFVIVGLAFGLQEIVYYSGGDNVHPNFLALLNPNTTSPMSLVIFDTYQIGADIFINLMWTYPVAYFVCVCGTQWIVLRDYNHHLEQSISDNPSEVLTKLEEYRILHLRLTGLVAQANQIFSPMLGLVLSANLVQVLLVLYIVSFPNPDDFPNYVIWMTIATIMSIMVIIPCDRVAAATACSCAWALKAGTMIGVARHVAGAIWNMSYIAQRLYSRVVGAVGVASVLYDTVEAHDILLELSPDEFETFKKDTLLCQMQMFLSRLQVPESYSAAGMMNANKELGITVVGVLASYYTVMVQFNRAPGDLSVAP